MKTTQFFGLRELDQNTSFEKGDVFVLFGELFGRGYANGLLNEVKRQGMTIIGSTVGRREKDASLRKLTDDELSEKEAELGGKIINIPLEAGFDMEQVDDGQSIVDFMNEVKFNDWEEFSIDADIIKKAVDQGNKRFRNNLRLFLNELKPMIPAGKNVYFAHIMAGGVPRSKIMLVVANRVFKGRGDRYIQSERLWKSGIGRITEQSFNEVTANTYKILLEETKDIQQDIKQQGKETFFSAYGYHGCEILINNQFTWQSYTPYQQGHAKKLLERVSQEAFDNGIKSVVFNCPEIRTNSSDIFAGVELSLFPFLLALEKELSADVYQRIITLCNKKLTDAADVNSILAELYDYFNSETLTHFQNFKQWPMENTHELAEIMVGISDKITQYHHNRKDLITDCLSNFIVQLSGKLIFNTITHAPNHVVWLGHDVMAKQFKEMDEFDCYNAQSSDGLF